MTHTAQRLAGLTLPITALLSSFAMQGASPADPSSSSGKRRPIKVLIISMIAPEGQSFVDHLQLDDEIMVPGLAADSPAVHCNADDVCQITTGMGHTNAAASVSALVWSSKFDLTHTYFIIAGIAGIDPTQGTLGSAAWARYLIDFGIAWEIDAREKPEDWSTGYLGINTKMPGEKPPLDYRTEVFQLNETLLQKALALGQSVQLEDSDQASAYRANWDIAPANRPPAIIQCDTAAGDTWWHGALLEKQAQDWTKLLTDGAGTYCTTQQEDNASYEALSRGASAGRLSLDRLAVLRSASNFDRPYPGQSTYDSLVTATSGGFVPATHNLYAAAGPLVAAIVGDWSSWQSGVPQ